MMPVYHHVWLFWNIYILHNVQSIYPTRNRKIGCGDYFLGVIIIYILQLNISGTLIYPVLQRYFEIIPLCQCLVYWGTSQRNYKTAASPSERQLWSHFMTDVWRDRIKGQRCVQSTPNHIWKYKHQFCWTVHFPSSTSFFPLCTRVSLVEKHIWFAFLWSFKVVNFIPLMKMYIKSYSERRCTNSTCDWEYGIPRPG